jgi:GT2 family glycosyltransferase
MATVGILMPTFERTDYLRTALRSALDQTFGDVAVYVGDNSATDAVERVVATIDDPRIHYRRNDRNLGVLGNWTTLMRHAETPYVATLHDDDIWEPTFLERAVPLLDRHADVGLVFVDHWIIDEHGVRQPAATAAEDERTRRRTLPTGRLELTGDEAVRMAVVWNAPQPAYAAVMRRDAVIDIAFPDGTDLVGDLWMSYTLARSSWRFAHVAERLTS